MWLQIGLLSIVISLGLVIVIVFLKYKQAHNKDPILKHIHHRQKILKKNISFKKKSYERRYAIYSCIPILRQLTHRIYIRFSFIGERDRNLLVKRIVRVLEGMILMDILLLFVFYQMTHNVAYSCIFIFFLWYIGDSYFDFFISQSHSKLLIQMKRYLSYVRQMYYEFQVIDDAVYEANQLLTREEHEMQVQGECMYEALIATDTEHAMNAYFEVAPNNFLKMFLNFAHMTMEYGDQKVDDRSVFLTNLDYLSKNIELEINKRKQLNYALKSMNFIVMIPLFLISMIKSWAVENFAPLSVFYNSMAGRYVEVLTIVVILTCMVIINNIQNLDRKPYEEGKYKKLLLRLPIAMTEGQKKRWLLFLLGSFITMGVFVTITEAGRQNIKNLVYYESNFLGGSYSIEEVNSRKDESREDYSFIRTSSQDITREEVETYFKNTYDYIDEARVNRVLSKVDMYHSLYLKWWQVMIVFGVGIIGYYLPEISGIIHARILKMDIEDEVIGFRSIIMMLIYHPRMSVEEIVEWLEKYSRFYKQELHRCLQNMSQGEYEALMVLKDSVEHEGMKKIAHQLALATEGLTLEETFDELLAEKVTFYEQRKWQNERLIEKKIITGQTVGFIPIYSLIILYLIIPLVVSSARELDQFFGKLF